MGGSGSLDITVPATSLSPLRSRVETIAVPSILLAKELSHALPFFLVKNTVAILVESSPEVLPFRLAIQAILLDRGFGLLAFQLVQVTVLVRIEPRDDPFTTVMDQGASPSRPALHDIHELTTLFRREQFHEMVEPMGSCQAPFLLQAGFLFHQLLEEIEIRVIQTELLGHAAAHGTNALVEQGNVLAERVVHLGVGRGLVLIKVEMLGNPQVDILR